MLPFVAPGMSFEMGNSSSFEEVTGYMENNNGAWLSERGKLTVFVVNAAWFTSLYASVDTQWVGEICIHANIGAIDVFGWPTAHVAFDSFSCFTK